MDINEAHARGLKMVFEGIARHSKAKKGTDCTICQDDNFFSEMEETQFVEHDCKQPGCQGCAQIEKHRSNCDHKDCSNLACNSCGKDFS